MRALILSCAALTCAPAFADPLAATGHFTRCVSDSCEIVVDGVFAYVEGGAGTPTDVMIALYEMDDGVQALRLTGEITAREDGFADLIVTQFTVLPDDPVADFAQGLQGRWALDGQNDDLVIDIDGLQWVEIRPNAARARWKLLPMAQCPDGTLAEAGALVFTLTPWRDEAPRPGCWQVISQSDTALTLRDLMRPQDPPMVLRAAP